MTYSGAGLVNAASDIVEDQRNISPEDGIWNDCLETVHTAWYTRVEYIAQSRQVGCMYKYTKGGVLRERLGSLKVKSQPCQLLTWSRSEAVV